MAWVWWTVAAAVAVTAGSLAAGRRTPGRHAAAPPGPPAPGLARTVTCARCDVPLAWLPERAPGGAPGWIGGPDGRQCPAGGWHAPLFGPPPLTPG